jgi:diacylglycerol kinase (ATP)
LNSGKTVLIYNPRAGKFLRGRAASLDRIASVLREHGHNVETAPTTGPSTAGGIARQYVENGARLVVAAGGDGTINEVMEGLVGSQTPLAILPGGTANVLATELRLEKDMARAAARISELQARRISVGHVTCGDAKVSRHFLLMCGVGLDAHIVYHVHGPLKAATGKLAYWIAGGSLFGRALPQMRAVAGGKTHECSFALLSKVRNYGGDFEIAQEVTLFDDRFEAVLFEGKSSTRYIRYLLATALRRLRETPGIEIFKTECMRITGPEKGKVYVQIDGEYAGRLPAEIRVVPDALTLMVPPEYGAG